MSGASKKKAMAFVNRKAPRETRDPDRRKKFDEIDERRRACGVSIDALCGRAFLAPTTWYRIAAGRTPHTSTLRKLRAALAAIERDTIEI